MTTFATVAPATAAFTFHATEAAARAAADAGDLLLATGETDLEALTGSQAVALFAATAAPLGREPVKRFASRGAAARRIWQNLAALSAAAPVVEAVAAQPVPQPDADAQQAAPKTQSPRKPRAITRAPKAEAVACRAGTKQALLVDLLFRPGGASMTELREALAPWKDVTIKSGLSWDMNSLKGYGICTTFENGYQRWLLCDYAGQGTFHADSHPDDLSEADKAALLADNLANGYNPDELFPVYHLVLPEGLTAPVPHTGGVA